VLRNFSKGVDMQVQRKESSLKKSYQNCSVLLKAGKGRKN
jgi:hypothetical protein